MTNAGGDSWTRAGIQPFPSTCWSRFLAGPGPGDGREAALEELARRYWRPVFTYIRARWSRPPDDARDLAQDFFLWMIEADFIDLADPRRGRFRGFVKVALEHYVANEERKRRSLKRGGGRVRLSIDDEEWARAVGEAPAPGPADEALDEAWRRELLERARARVEEELRREDRDLQARLFREYYLHEGPEINYRELAARHGLSENQVLAALQSVRERFRAAVAALVGETVGSPEELREELQALFGVKAP